MERPEVTRVAILEKTRKTFGLDLAARGHHVVYHVNERNRCPGCGRVQWFVGRVTAECGFCGTALALAEVHVGSTGQASGDSLKAGHQRRKPLAKDERRQHERIDAAGRTLQLMVDGAPHSFALHNLSAGGAMGDDPIGLTPGTELHVRFEGGIVVPAVIKWSEGQLVGLAFTSGVTLDLPASA
jgi:hypothetical protein